MHRQRVRSLLLRRSIHYRINYGALHSAPCNLSFGEMRNRTLHRGSRGMFFLTLLSLSLSNELEIVPVSSSRVCVFELSWSLYVRYAWRSRRNYLPRCTVCVLSPVKCHFGDYDCSWNCIFVTNSRPLRRNSYSEHVVVFISAMKWRILAYYGIIMLYYLSTEGSNGFWMFEF